VSGCRGSCLQCDVNGAVALQAPGGTPTGTGTFIERTVLVDVDQSMSCMTEETLGATGDQGGRLRSTLIRRFAVRRSVWPLRPTRAGEVRPAHRLTPVPRTVVRLLDWGHLRLGEPMQN
jgi:hypothetical protein